MDGTVNFEATAAADKIVISGASPTFTGHDDDISFLNAGVHLDDGTFTVNSQGGAISIVGAVTGSSAEAITLNSGVTGSATVAVDDIGEVIALQLTEYFEQDANLEELARLQKAGLQFDMEVVKAPSEGPLVGAKVVVSGVFESFSRDELKMLIETLGGQNVSSISSKTTYVVAGEGIGPSKKAKAEKLDVPILNEDEFKALIQ